MNYVCDCGPASRQPDHLGPEEKTVTALDDGQQALPPGERSQLLAKVHQAQLAHAELQLDVAEVDECVGLEHSSDERLFSLEAWDRCFSWIGAVCLQRRQVTGEQHPPIQARAHGPMPHGPTLARI